MKEMNWVRKGEIFFKAMEGRWFNGEGGRGKAGKEN